MKSCGFSPGEPDARRSALESAQYLSQVYVFALSPSFVKLRMLQSTLLVPSIDQRTN